MTSAAAHDLAIVDPHDPNCRCVGVDAHKLRSTLALKLGEIPAIPSLLDTHPNLLALSPVFVAPSQVKDMQRIVDAVEQVVASPSYQHEVLAAAPEIARQRLGPRGVFLGYDFHLTDQGPRLIEINTNAGGALLGVYLAAAQHACCDEIRGLVPGPVDPSTAEATVIEMFRSEWRLQGADRALRRIAIVDRSPETQFLYPELQLFQRLFQRHGVDAVIADPQQLSFHHDALWLDELEIDLVYCRLTDFTLDHPENAAIRQAYLSGHTVLTPHPRAHTLYANKKNLAILSDPLRLRALGVDEDVIAVLHRGVPKTVLVTAENADALWASRRELFFKPAAGYGSRGTYRGSKLTRKVWQQILEADYVAQQQVAPSERSFFIEGEDRVLKLDLRCVVYDGTVQLHQARLYRGQTTNLRTPGGGIAPVFTTTA